MQDAYFQLVSKDGMYGLMLHPASEGGSDLKTAEVQEYIEMLGCRDYNLTALHAMVLSKEESFFPLGEGVCPSKKEDYKISMASDQMSVTARFFPPSENGQRMTVDEFLKDLKFRNIKAGIQYRLLKEHFMENPIYCKDLIIALGKEPRQGFDAQIKYYFNTNIQTTPTLLEDGSVDFFHLNIINHCKKGDILARIIPADEGEMGENVVGARLKPREVKRISFQHGKNVVISEDRLTLLAATDGHVMLDNDSVCVSDVFCVENVDMSTGNIDFEGSVQINGNVNSNFEIVAGGNVVINGVVEGASITAGGNIIIARGMNGMMKGTLKAGGNIVSKFLENASATAGGYVHTESILHTDVSAGSEVILSGKKGFITGGHIHAGQKVVVKTLGATMGAPTIVEVGVDPEKKMRFMQTQREVAEIVRTIKNAQPLVANYIEKRNKGVHFTEEQVNYIKNVSKTLEEKKHELEEKSELMKRLQEEFTPTEVACVEVQGVVYPGTTIVIGDVSTVVNSNFQYCRFEKRGGDVRMAPL